MGYDWTNNPETGEDVLRGRVTFTPGPTTPSCRSIRIVQAARVETKIGQDLDWRQRASRTATSCVPRPTPPKASPQAISSTTTPSSAPPAKPAHPISATPGPMLTNPKTAPAPSPPHSWIIPSAGPASSASPWNPAPAALTPAPSSAAPSGAGPGPSPATALSPDQRLRDPLSHLHRGPAPLRRLLPDPLTRTGPGSCK